MVNYSNEDRVIKLISYQDSIDRNKPMDLKKNFGFLYFAGVDTVKLDFKPTKDNYWICSHDSFYKMKPIGMQRRNDLKLGGLLTLENVLDIIPPDLGLLVDIKSTLISQNDAAIVRLINVLNSYANDRMIQVQSFHDDFVRELIRLREGHALSNDVSLGLVVSKMNTKKFQKPKDLNNPFGLGSIDFLSLSSELWEESSAGNEQARYHELFPETERYAWTRMALHPETGSQIINYADKGADGIIANSPAMVKSYLEKH